VQHDVLRPALDARVPERLDVAVGGGKPIAVAIGSCRHRHDGTGGTRSNTAIEASVPVGDDLAARARQPVTPAVGRGDD
jgi:hypothetical protein